MFSNVLYIYPAYVVLQLFFCMIYGDIINKLVIREIHTETPLVKIKTNLTLQNHESHPIESITYITEPETEGFYVHYLTENGSFLSYTNNGTSKADSRYYQIVHFDKRVLPNEEYKLRIVEVYSKKVTPALKGRKLNETELVKCTGNVYIYSPYHTLVLKSRHFDKNSEEKDKKPFIRYNDLPPFSYESFQIEFETSKLFLVITDLKRTIDVSHFGAIFVEEHISIKNAGAKFIGPYEPIHEKPPGPQWFYTHLPASAQNIKFYDILGNNSKSAILDFEDHKTIKFGLRYPLMGGWKSSYILKYSVPIYEYLYHSSNTFVLRMRALDHTIDDCVVMKATTKIILPSASFIVNITVPPGFQRGEDELSYTALAVRGKPTVVLNGIDLFDVHIENFELRYILGKCFEYESCIFLIIYLEFLFVGFIVFLRLHTYLFDDMTDVKMCTIQPIQRY